MKQLQKTSENKGKMDFLGIHTFSFCDGRSRKAQELTEEMERLRIRRMELLEKNALTPDVQAIMHEMYQKTKREYIERFKTKETVVKNLIVNAGLNAIARRIGSDNTYTGNVNYGLLGDDDTAVAVTDTTLGNEVYRKALSDSAIVNQTVRLEMFYTMSEVSGTFEEYGFAIDGTGAADSGVLFNRFTEQNVKTTFETLNVSSEILLANA